MMGLRGGADLSGRVRRGCLSPRLAWGIILSVGLKWTSLCLRGRLGDWEVLQQRLVVVGLSMTDDMMPRMAIFISMQEGQDFAS